jgi:hypothetical protein
VKKSSRSSDTTIFEETLKTRNAKVSGKKENKCKQYRNILNSGKTVIHRK